jgi:hypothetical protein
MTATLWTRRLLFFFSREPVLALVSKVRRFHLIRPVQVRRSDAGESRRSRIIRGAHALIACLLGDRSF